MLEIWNANFDRKIDDFKTNILLKILWSSNSYEYYISAFQLIFVYFCRCKRSIVPQELNDLICKLS